MPHIAFVGLGSNLQDPGSQLQHAFSDLDRLPGTRLLQRSSLYRSAPVGYLDQPDFVNAVAKIETALTPHELLQALLQIEHDHGRERTFRNAPRTLDLDVLLYDDLQLHEHGLTIPHPQMHLRAFVLQPLLEIAPDCVIPGVGSAEQALHACAGQVLERMQDVAQ
ncbi:2-amino-4-hydroxy-6-hydroxymethyldihydropteridine diphosphokinase [Ferrigenium kumadai]|uniref:2-amino-4-hydroxy-6-hydroxymethyldihydropteridine pyrophosphokinase n=1 Tax=Ferrigenium kumadai TaxID=1682490 RepID=A0AAN1SXZ1_9PROT|nr:2-amino-4-hydroxy-6-hydroxymethyldihydropteridine diphosphokinase [Ferrigenium kumadai]BBI99040.1 2-amino-4-hydroxy-6-hydroxymethyldihydropteridine diphosphokinase [Ferrigenium kumadai]